MFVVVAEVEKQKIYQRGIWNVPMKGIIHLAATTFFLI